MAGAIYFVYVSNMPQLEMRWRNAKFTGMENECYNPEIRLLQVAGSLDLHGWWETKDLAAPFWRLYWNDSPGAFIRHDGRDRSLGPEKIMLIAPDTPYSSSCPGHSRQLFIHFLVGVPYSNLQPGIYEFPVEDAFWRAHLARTLKVAAEGPSSRRLRSLLALRAVVYGLELIPERLLGIRRLDPRVARAMDALAPGKPLKSNDELAQQSGMSANAFLRLFRQSTGASPQFYSRMRRIEEASMLLQYSQLDIKSIAERTGFCDRYHFSRVFKSLRGVSPAGFRRSL